MRLQTALNAAAHAVSAAALSFGLAANANAQEQCLPGVFNPQRGIQPKDCYTTPELNKAMAALGQRSLIKGDRYAVGDDANGQVIVEGRINLFTSNGDGSVGYNVEGDAPSNKPSSYWSVRTVMSDVRLYDRDVKVTPSPEIVGILHAKGIERSKDRLMLSAKFGNNTHLIVVARDMKPTIGSFMAANSQKGADLAGMKNLDYTPLGLTLIKEQKQASIGTQQTTLAATLR